MKVWASAILAAVTLASGSLPSAEAQRQVTLDESIEIAIAQSPALKGAAEAVESAKWDVVAAAGARLPSLGAEASHTKYDKATIAEIMGQEIPITQSHQENVNVTATIPIDISKTIGRAKDLADSGLDAARLDYAAALDELVYQVSSGYLNVLKAQAGLKVAEKGLERSNEQLRVAEAAFRAGTAARYDVLRADVAVASAKEQVINARNGLELSLSAFHTVLGGVEAEPTYPEGLIELVEPAGGLPEVASCLERAKAERPEVLKAQVGVQLGETGVFLAGAGLKPQMAFSWNWGWQGPVSPFGGRSTQWIGVLGLKIPILDGGVTQSKVEGARSQLRAAESGLVGVRLLVDLEVRQAYANLVNASERYQVAAANLTQAEEAHRLASLRFREGASISLEVVDSEVALTAAETSLVTAAYDYRIAASGLDRATASRSSWPDAARTALAEYGPPSGSDSLDR